MAERVAQARVSGPVSGGRYGWPFAATLLDLQKLGYEQAEYFLEGEATRYRQVEGSNWGRDGRWRVEPAGQAGFKTRFLVYRPKDPARFNGTVVVTWNNVTAGYELFGADSLEIFEGGYALVCASVQKVGLEGLPPVRQGLVHWDPDRYGTLAIASDDYSYDIFTRIGRAVGPMRDAGNCDPMAGLTVRRIIAQGASQSAGRLATYINALSPFTSVFDGYVLSIYFGRGTPIEVGDAVVDINAPSDSSAPGDRLRGVNLIRDDRQEPVFVVNSELEAMACYDVRQPDTDRLRWWESAGTCHVSQQIRAARERLAQRDKLVTRPGNDSINAIPMAPLYDAAFHHMHRWLSDSVPPPVQPRIEFSGTPAQIVRDENGIARGGIRLPQAEVPLALNSALPLSNDIFAFLGGSSKPFAAARVRELYGDRAAFLGRFESAARRAVDAGVLRPREVARLLDEAAAAWPD